MELQDLQSLLLVVEHGSFQRAATAQRVSRSQLRRQVDRLEKALGVPLLHRGAGGIELTSAGTAAVARAAPLLQDVAAFVDEVRSSKDEARGVLRFIVPVGLPAEMRAQALLRLRAVNADLHIKHTESDDPVSRIGEPFDLMFHFGPAPQRDGWFSRVLTRVPTELRASRRYLDEHGTPTTIDELRDHTLLKWRIPGTHPPGLPLKEGGHASVNPWLESTNLAMLISMAEAGIGIVYMGAFAAEVPETGGGLVRVLEDEVGGVAVMRALSPRPSRLDPRIHAMIENAADLADRVTD